MSQDKVITFSKVQKSKLTKPRFNRYRPRQMRKTREEYEALQILSLKGHPADDDEVLFKEYIPLVAVALAKDAAKEIMHWVARFGYMDKAITMKLFHHSSGVLKVECPEVGRFYYSLIIPHNYLQSKFGDTLTARFVNAIDTILAINHHSGKFENFECIIWDDFTFKQSK